MTSYCRIFALLVGLSLVATAQESEGKRTVAQMKEDYKAHRGDFDYLLGDWEFTVTSKDYGKNLGYWSAVRLDTGQVLDEFRVVSDKGETYHVSSTVRSYNMFQDRWELVTMEQGNGLLDFGTGKRVGDEVHIEQKFGVNGGRPSVLRIRYYNIQADRFSWVADKSTDGGKTWVKDHQQIEARRIGPARSMGALAPARNAERSK